MIIRCLKSAAKLFVFAATALVLTLSAAHACTRVGMPAGAVQIVPTKNLNQSLFNKTVLSEINYMRCKAGVGPVKLAGGLINVAGNHASWMASKRNLSHNSTVRGQSSVQERVLASGLRVRRGSENIGNVPRYQFGKSKRIRIKSRSRCEFTTTSGKAIAPHSYLSLASQIVDMWMKSPGHRKNMLDRNATVVGHAIDFDARASHCGQYYMAQNFAG